MVKNLPVKGTSFNKTSFELKTDMSQVDVVDNLCSISGRVYSYNFDTDSPIENLWMFKAENKDKGLKIEVQFYDINV